MNSKKEKISLFLLVVVLFIALILGLTRKILPEIDNIGTLAEPSESNAEYRDPSAVKVPNFTITNTDSQNVDFLKYTGTPIVLNFWDSSSETSAEDLKIFEELILEYSAEVSFIFINYETDALSADDDVLAFLEENEIEYVSTHFDNFGEAVALFGIKTFPTTAFIDSDGYLISGVIGSGDKETISSHIENILY